MLPSSPIRKRLALLLALQAGLLLSGCGDSKVRFIPPPPERMAAVERPQIPPATTPCGWDAKEACNSDEELAQLVAAYDGALAEANRRIAWLRNFFAAVPR